MRTVSYHIGQIIDTEKLNKYSVIRKNWITANNGKPYETMLYNLDVTIAVGYPNKGIAMLSWKSNPPARRLTMLDFSRIFHFFFLITDETSSFCRLFAFSLIFSPFSSYLFILFRYLCGVIARNEGHSWPKSRRWHYILKGVTDACFWTSELPQIETEQKQCRWLPRGVVYTLRSVLRGYLYPHAHFTDVLYSPTWVFLCRVFL